jgi:CelD/BcsL family acetyltransferase involved in cellulose biosynthesis
MTFTKTIPYQPYLNRTLRRKRLTNQLVISREDFDSISAYYLDPDLHLNWNLVFTLPAWLKVWWQHFSAGAELHIRSVKEDEKIIGIAPLQIKDQTASIIGSINVCDYQDFIVSPGHEINFFKNLLEDLKQKNIRKLHLETIRPDSTIVNFLMPLSEELGYQVDYHQTDVSSDIALPSSWDDYLKILDPKQRHELRRKLRNLDDIGRTEFRTITDKTSISSSIDTFLNLFPESRRDKAEFLTSDMKSFFRSLALSLSEVNAVGLGSLELAGKPLAMVMFFDYNGNNYLYNSAYDPDYKQFSVGIISKALCIRNSILNKKSRFDFLKGPEQYKLYLGGKEIPLFSCEITLGEKM